MKKTKEKELKENKENIRERIIVAAITVLERDGLGEATSRAIAAQAGVNLAAINYYFGSKDKVLENAVKHAMDEVFVRNMAEQFPGEWELNREILTKVGMMIIIGGAQFPNLSRLMVTTEPKSNISLITLQSISDFIHWLLQKAPKISDQAKRKEWQLFLFQYITEAIYFPNKWDLIEIALNDPVEKSGNRRKSLNKKQQSYEEIGALYLNQIMKLIPS